MLYIRTDTLKYIDDTPELNTVTVTFICDLALLVESKGYYELINEERQFVKSPWIEYDVIKIKNDQKITASKCKLFHLRIDEIPSSHVKYELFIQNSISAPYPLRSKKNVYYI